MTSFFKLLLFLLLPILTFGQKTILKKMQHGGLTRDYRVYVPKSYDGSKAVPLVFNLHGYSSNEVQQELYGDFRAIADTANFIVVHPRGTAVAANILFWNVGFVPSSIDDVGFLTALIDTISTNYNINPQRVYSTGMSNGGFMSYSLACNSNRFAAIASVTGSITRPMLQQCKPSKPIPILEIHGTNDPTVPYNGSNLFAPIDTVVNFWVKHNACTPTPSTSDVPNTNATDGATAIHSVYTGGKNGATVEHYKVTNGAHTWPGAAIVIGVTCMDFSASKEIWRFFSQHSLITSTHAAATPLSFELSPNPTQEYIKVVTEASFATTQLSIIDIQGKIVVQKTLERDQEQIDISTLANGFYIVKLQQLNHTAIQKLIKY